MSFFSSTFFLNFISPLILSQSISLSLSLSFFLCLSLSFLYFSLSPLPPFFPPHVLIGSRRPSPLTLTHLNYTHSSRCTTRYVHTYCTYCTYIHLNLDNSKPRRVCWKVSKFHPMQCWPLTIRSGDIYV